MTKHRQSGYYLFLCLLLAGCIERDPSQKLAPVSVGYSVERARYIVKKGDTLFSIAWRFDKDYKMLAYYNRLKDDQVLKPGQVIRLTTPATTAKSRYVKASKVKAHSKVSHTPVTKKKTKLSYRKPKWHWPVSGQVTHTFSLKKQQKGIDITGRYGSSITATAPGIVAYSGSGLRGYGNLVILKHNGGYLSAYAFNRKIIVKEGQHIKENQKIAEMGRRKGKKGLLHFEIRYNGKPVNPLKFLPRH